MNRTHLKLLATCLLIVFCFACEDDYIPTSSLDLSSSSIVLSIDSTKTIFAEVAPVEATNKSLNWTSSDPAIASVDQNGEITAKSVGSAEISAQTVDGLQSTTVVNVVKVTSYALPEEFRGWIANPTGLAFDDKNTLWIGAGPYLYNIGNNGAPLSFQVLPNRTDINNLTFDNNGIMWLATHSNGLIRYDGSNFTNYELFSDTNVPYAMKGLDIDSQGDIWVTLSGQTHFGTAAVAKFDGQDFQLVDIPASIKKESDSAFDLFIDDQDNVYLALDGNFDRVLLYDNNGWSTFTDGNHSVIDMTTDQDGKLWMAAFESFLVYDNPNFTLFESHDISRTVNDGDYTDVRGLFTIDIDQYDVKWSSTSRGVLRYDDNNWQLLDYESFGLFWMRHSIIDELNNKWFIDHEKVFKIED